MATPTKTALATTRAANFPDWYQQVVTAADLALPPPAEGTAEAAARVAAARARQAARAAEAGEGAPTLNARADGAFLEKALALDEAARALMSRAAEAGRLTARGWTRTLRLARTIADLDGCDGVLRRHIAEALIYRRSTVGAEADYDRQVATKPSSLPAW